MRNLTTGHPAPEHNYIHTMRRRVMRELVLLVVSCILLVLGLFVLASAFVTPAAVGLL